MTKEYEINNEERQMASEPAAISVAFNTRDDISRAITADELIARLRPRIKELFQ